MRVLVVGSGAREHALVTRLAADAAVRHLVCAPGNPGISAIARTVAVDPTKADLLLDLVKSEGIDLTIVGPELPLSHGVADRFAEAGQRLFGPTKAAARLESSKAFAKAFMTRHGVPTARFQVCSTADAALQCVASGEYGFPVVLKADGLAAGKGVVIAQTAEEASSAVTAAMQEGRFGSAGATLVIEECLTGPEVSFFVVADGATAVPIGTAQDHKRIFDDDRGPNTGGMGAFAPSPLVDASLERAILDTIVHPVVKGMAAEGHPFRGFLYVGLMLTADGPKVIEFNVRLGDPEAQVILSRIADPLAPLLASAAEGAIGRASCRLSDENLVGVVMASRGYPETSESGRPITGIARAEQIPNVTVYHAGTAMRDGVLVTAGGRVLTVVGRAATMAAAIETAYAGVACIAFDGAQYRRDIGRKALAAMRARP